MFNPQRALRKENIERFFFTFCLLLVSSCGATEKVVSNSPLIGTLLTTDSDVYYGEGCKEKSSCADSDKVAEIDKALICSPRKPASFTLYEQVHKIQRSRKFEIIEVLDIYKRFGGHRYMVVVLRDEKGTLSTRPEFMIDLEKKDLCG